MSENPPSKEELLTDLVRVADKLGRSPTTREIDEHGSYSFQQYYRHYDNWDDALEEAGLSPPQRTISTEEKIREIQRLRHKIGHTPRLRDMNEKGKYSEKPYLDEWGTWNEALAAAGLKPNLQRNISDQELLKEIHRLKDQLDRTPRKIDLQKHGQFGEQPYRDRWGSWNDALVAAGLSPNQEVNISKEKLLEELRRLASELGEPPLYDQMDEIGEYSGLVYENKFNSWIEALVQAGLHSRERRPLIPESLHRFHQAAKNREPTKSFIGLLFMFTGFNVEAFADFSPEWVRELAGEYIIRIPNRFAVDQSRPWEFRLPEKWNNPYTGDRERTKLVEAIEWRLEHNTDFDQSRQSTTREIHRIAADAGLTDHRKIVNTNSLSGVPQVRPVDLFESHGVELARNGNSKKMIKRRLGLESIEDARRFFYYLNQDRYASPA